ncbi:Trimethylguanosine synthase [Schistosoma japonicum]|uniref:Trimethylguanosine synthase n=1 Tax=Schistosoma japonicum TaxID=6182 RepID=A0A4Z2DHZ2_SCHJA|nr:Trimethylguanosine synthase [Schistosoma japonicum]
MFSLRSNNIIDSLSDVSSSDDESEATCHQISSPDDEIPVPSQRFTPVSLTEVLRKRNKVAKVLFNSSKVLPKYWKRRYDLFERFDEGVQLDEESWYSVTPEAIARHQAKTCSCDLLIDAFAGVGGNTIQFAQTCRLVLAIENCFPRLLMLQNNAKIYSVLSKIMLVCGDVEKVLSSLRNVQLSTSSTNDYDTNVQTLQYQCTNNNNSVATLYSPKEHENNEPSLNFPSETSVDVDVNVLQSNLNLSDHQDSSLHSRNNDNNNSIIESSLKVDPQSNVNDTLEIINSEINSLVDIVFMSPPWGGPDYIGRIFPPGSTSWNQRKRKHWLYDIDEIEPIKNLEDITCLHKALNISRHICSKILIYLPRNSSIGQLIQMSWPIVQSVNCEYIGNCYSCKQYLNVHIETYCLRGRQLALGLYLGNFPNLEEEIIVPNKVT